MYIFRILYMDELNFKGKLYLQVGDIRAIGPGRVELLERINSTGSIRQAALQMQMSYRQAWENVDEMNSVFAEPLVTSVRGGKGGGKAEITTKGLQLIKLFKEVHSSFQEFLQEQTLKIEC
ncbi:MAG: LysR family transcriptional regulator [Pedobacter sp.]|nr:MAG: LysR family transcriptional regulator [Pedobacter sp.]